MGKGSTNRDMNVASNQNTLKIFFFPKVSFDGSQMNQPEFMSARTILEMSSDWNFASGDGAITLPEGGIKTSHVTQLLSLLS